MIKYSIHREDNEDMCNNKVNIKTKNVYVVYIIKEGQM